MTLETSMETALRRIFDIEKVTFDFPSVSKEQEGIFIQVDKVITRIKDQREVARVTGLIRVFASVSKMPMGYFAKRLHEADPKDKAGFFFSDFESVKGQMVDLVERSAAFTYFYNGQFDPATGMIESINLTVSEY